MSLGWILVLAMVGLMLVMALSCVYFSWLMKRMVFSQLQDLETVRATGLPPEHWEASYRRQCRKAGHIDPKRFQRQKKKNLRRLNDLIRYAEKTTLVEDEHARRDVLRQLGAVKADWASQDVPAPLF